MLDSNILNCYVSNFELRFTDAVYGGKIIKTVKLTKGTICESDEWLTKWILSYKHRSVYTVQFGNEKLYLSGYNFLNTKASEGRYPVFSPFAPKIYFDKNYAQEICDKHNHLFDGKLKVV